MGDPIKFPNANEEQNKILNMIAEQKSKEAKASQDKFDAEKDKEEFLYLWKHFDDRLQRMLNDFKDDTYNSGIHSLEVNVTVKKKGATDAIKEQFIYCDKLKLFKTTELD
jgi:hypothetical protein